MNRKYHEIYRKKAEELVSQMTIEEKCSQLSAESPAIERLGIPSYNWWNEGLHGVARAGVATIFPQAIGLAATFDREVLRTVGDVTSREGRIKYNAAQKHGNHSIYRGLTFWSPNINIFRDPRWGRGHETYGEDPVLTAQCAESYIIALQGGDDERYMRAAACAKHAAAHSGPEGIRHGFNSEVSDFDLHDTYLPAFEWCVKKADVEGLMGAYNMINGIPSCGHEAMIEGLFRKEWGFNGYFVSDCGALADMHMFCLVTHTAVESAAMALHAGCDLNCGQVYLSVWEAYNEGLVTEEEIDRSAVRVMATRFKLGLFDPECPFNGEDDYAQVECAAHREAAYRAATRSAVLLKNEGALPLDHSKIQTVGVIGPNADSIRALEGNYNGTSSRYTTILRGIQDECAANGGKVLYAKGCHLYKEVDESCAFPRDGFSEALTVTEDSDAVVMVMGLDSSIEGEQGDANNEYGAGDTVNLAFPGLQQELMETVAAAAKAQGKPFILVVLAGCALNLSWAKENADAILYGWYPGCEGGRAIADLLFGNVNPSGRTPVTFYRSVEDLPAFEDYNMAGRTYRYMKAEPLFPFGYGLSYTEYEYGGTAVSGSAETGDLAATVTVKNIGTRAGSEVVQIYATYGEERYLTPNCKLCGFVRVELAPGEERTVTVPIAPEAVMLTDRDGSRYLPQTLKLTAAPQGAWAGKARLV